MAFIRGEMQMKQINIMRFRAIMELLIENSWCHNMSNSEYSVIMNNCGVFVNNIRHGDGDKSSFIESIETISMTIAKNKYKNLRINTDQIEYIAREIIKKIEITFSYEEGSKSIAEAEARLTKIRPADI